MPTKFGTATVSEHGDNFLIEAPWCEEFIPAIKKLPKGSRWWDPILKGWLVRDEVYTKALVIVSRFFNIEYED
jgi:hypothetical protein